MIRQNMGVVRLAVAAVLLCGSLQAQVGQTIAITHTTVIDGTGTAPKDDSTVVIRGDRIIDVSHGANGLPPGTKIIDGRDKSVMPGLADMHVHLVGGWDGVSADLMNFRLYMNALLFSGVTTVLDTGNVEPYVLQLRQEVDAGRLPGPHIYCVGSLIDGADPVWPPFADAVASETQIPNIVRQKQLDKVDLLKAYVGLSDPMVRRLASEGKKSGLRVIVDQWVRNGSTELMDDGIAGFAHLPIYALTPDAISHAKSNNIFFITTLSVYESFARRRFSDMAFLQRPLLTETTPPWVLDNLRTMSTRRLTEGERTDAARWLQNFHHALQDVKRLYDSGILLTAGTDAYYPGDFQGEGMHHELELLVEAGLTPVQAISVATRNAARMMGAEQEWGTIAVGKRADLLVVRGRPDKNISDTQKIEMVIQHGVILDRDALRYDPRHDPGYRPVKGVQAGAPR